MNNQEKESNAGGLHLKRRTKVWIVLLGVSLFLFIYNTSFFARPVGDAPFLMAHRALGQDFSREGLTGATCTAARMIPSSHEFLENTLPSMTAAFEYGAAYVELDVHLTRDDSFAVFHDWTVDCRTEGSGDTRFHTMDSLRVLDIGYGYTADGGKTWPFRGKGVGLMPSLTDVFEAFPDRNFFIDIKSNDPVVGERLAARISELSDSYSGELILTGGPKPVNEVLKRLPELRSITRPQLKACVIRYMAVGWTGYVPSACSNSMLLLPANVAPWLWGWPNRFAQRMESVGTGVGLIGDYGGEGFSQGFNDVSRVRDLPEGYTGGVWTDRIDLIGPAIRNR